MADSKLSALTALTGADTADTDLYAVVDVSAGSAGSKKQTLTEARVALFKAEYTILPGALEAVGGYVVNPGGVGKTFYSSHGLASIGEGAFTYADFAYASLTHTFKVGTAGDTTALTINADASVDFVGPITSDGDAVITDATLPAALAGLSAPVSVGPYSIDELVGGLNALLLYLEISPAVLVDDDGNAIVDENGNLIIG